VRTTLIGATAGSTLVIGLLPPALPLETAAIVWPSLLATDIVGPLVVDAAVLTAPRLLPPDAHDLSPAHGDPPGAGRRFT
jgi:hypothetical protein